MYRFFQGFGALLILLGSLGQMLVGPAIGEFFFEIFQFDVNQRQQPLVWTLQLQWAAACGVTLICGMLILTTALAMRPRDRTTSVRGKLLFAGAAALMIAAAFPSLIGVFAARGTLASLAAANAVPTAEQFEAMRTPVTLPMRIGGAIQLIAAILAAAAALGGREKLVEPDAPPRVNAVVTTASVAVGLLTVIATASILRNQSNLLAMLNGVVAAKPAQLANHISEVFIKAIALHAAIGWLALMQLIAAVNLRLDNGPTPDKVEAEA